MEKLSDYSILYQYWVKDKAYCGNSNYNFRRGQSIIRLKLHLVGKRFPLADAVKDASMGALLLTQENADRFHYQCPDSLEIYDSHLTCKH